MSESEQNFVVEDKRLSLIDVSFEDDSLYSSPSRDNHSLPDSFEGSRQVMQRLESFEPDSMKKIGKYNLRKSLAWDSAFFTSAGVLEPEELSSMIDGSTEKAGKFALPGIEEEVTRSTDSLSTLASDSLTLETLEADLFCDVRASIQRSNAATALASNGKVGLVSTNSQAMQTLDKLNNAPPNKLKTKSFDKKPNVVAQASRKISKPVSVYQQASQSVSKNGDSALSLCKPPKATGRVSFTLPIATKRASLSAGPTKAQSDKDRRSSVRGKRIPSSSGSQNNVPRLKPPIRSSSSSLAMKIESTTSSFDSSGSVSSHGSSKSSLSSVKSNIRSPSGGTARTALRITTKLKSQPMSTHRSPHLKSVSNPTSSISPVSSVSEWSCESLSPKSNFSKMSNSSIASVEIGPCEVTSVEAGAFQVLDFQNHSIDKCSLSHGNDVQALVAGCAKGISAGSKVICPDSNKPSGLRMPSPKIGFFDGVKSANRAPNGNIHSHTALPNHLQRCGGGAVSPVGGSNEIRTRKMQATRPITAVRSAKSAQKSPSAMKATSPVPIKEDSKIDQEDSVASKNNKNSPGSSLKVQSRVSPGSGGKSNVKVAKGATKVNNTFTNDPDLVLTEKNGSPHVLQDHASIKEGGVTPADGERYRTPKSKAMSGEENILVLEKGGKDELPGNDSDAVNGESFHFEGKVDCLINQLQAVDLNEEKQELSSLAADS